VELAGFATRWYCPLPSFTIQTAHMKRSTAFFVILVLVVGLLVAAGASTLHNGLSARATPTKLEESMARHLWQLSIPANARSTPNPVPNTPQNLADARLHFADHCAICHANDGSGNAVFGRGLYPKPPDLRLQATQERTDGELFWVVENGVRFTGMPSFAGHGTADDSWKLVSFIRHLPQLTAEEKMEMSANNPKSPEDRAEDRQEDDFLNGTTPADESEPPSHHR
jgi:mono/diheme cytochrome c family protein